MNMLDPIKEKILAAGLDLVNRYGYGSLGISELAREADMTKQRLYYHFPTPEDVMVVLAQRWSETGQACAVEALANTHEVGAYRLLALSDGIFDWIEKYQELSRLGLVLYQSTPHIKKLNNFLTEARKVARNRVKDILLQEKKFQKMSPSEMDKFITAYHSMLHGFYFYLIAINEFENLKVHKFNCRENLRRLIDSYLK